MTAGFPPVFPATTMLAVLEKRLALPLALEQVLEKVYLALLLGKVLEKVFLALLLGKVLEKVFLALLLGTTLLLDEESRGCKSEFQLFLRHLAEVRVPCVWHLWSTTLESAPSHLGPGNLSSKGRKVMGLDKARFDLADHLAGLILDEVWEERIPHLLEVFICWVR
jgi:hypothetical protein